MNERYTKFWSPAFDTMPDFVFLIDKDFNIINVNKSFLAFAKKEKEDFIGVKCHEVRHAMNTPIDGCPHEEMLKTKTFESSEFYDTTLKKWLRVSTTPIFDEKDNLMGSIHIAADITEHKNADEALKKKIRDLERFQRITVDRELKMKELKARITELEEKLKNA